MSLGAELHHRTPQIAKVYDSMKSGAPGSRTRLKRTRTSLTAPGQSPNLVDGFMYASGPFNSSFIQIMRSV
ncbi:MAG: hypothetical protein L6M37_02770 [Candidatus Methylarchaceae archaeon HK02M1]|nr:hypothetical protein [Candidatus Methylarchaceae archaeon HK02M1]